MFDTIKEASSNGKELALGMFCNCCTRNLMMEGGIEKELSLLKSKYKNLPLFGFFSFGEFGSTPTSSAQLHSETVTSLIIFDKLLVD